MYRFKYFKLSNGIYLLMIHFKWLLKGRLHKKDKIKLFNILPFNDYQSIKEQITITTIINNYNHKRNQVSIP